MKKLFFIYTNPRFLTALYEPVMAEAFGNREDLEVYFTCDTSILADSLKNNAEPDESVEKRLNRLIDNCIDAGADCVVVGCTVMNTATEKLSAQKKVPVFNIDAPMEEKIVQDKVQKAAILSHAEDNAQTIERQLKKRGIDCSIFVVPQAAQANQAGDRKLLSDLYRGQAEKIQDSFEAIVLGHISADNVDFGAVQNRIYRSGQLCIEEINRVLEYSEAEPGCPLNRKGENS